MVVKVVANDSCEFLGELKVLFARPPYAPSVYVVPEREYPVSDCIVSAFVASVGAVDLLLLIGTACPLVASSYEAKLLTRPEVIEPGVNEEVLPLVVLGKCARAVI